jgi:exopolysaccharide biosynthesis polyprenyl glycosylphosphotransferase
MTAEAAGGELGSAASAASWPAFEQVERTAHGARRPFRATLQRGTIKRAALVLVDVACAALTLLVIRRAFGYAHIAPAFVGSLLVVVLCKLAGLYDDDELRLTSPTIDEIPTLLKLSGLFALGITIATPIVTGGELHGAEVAAVWITLFASLTCGRTFARWFAERVSPVERCLVVGDRGQAGRIRERLDAQRARAVVVGALPISGRDLAELVQPDGEGVILRLVEDLRVTRIIIAPDQAIDEDLAALVRIVRAAGIRLSVVPKTLSGIGSRFVSEEVNGLWLIGVGPFGLSSASRLLKRSFDLLVAAVGVCVIAPVMCLIALAIKLDTRGPVFFRQVRVGQDGKPFRMIKFRSMVADAEALKEDLRALSEVGEGMFKIAEDPRVTRIGRVLRKTSLDELPQLVNVLRGEMSLVGPRPLVVDEDAAILGVDRSRLHLPPGITGPWQVLRKRVSREDMIEIDYRYAADWTLWSDVRILLRTVMHVVRQSNY